jgi:hypothetical protein
MRFGETFVICYQTKFPLMLCQLKLSNGIANIHRLRVENKVNNKATKNRIIRLYAFFAQTA